MNFTYLLTFLILLIGGFIFYMCTKSSFESRSSIDSTSIKPGIASDSVIIFFAPWCGYCKSNLPQFKDAVARGQGKVVLVDATDPDNKELTTKYNVRGYPTIIKADRTAYKGNRTADDILDFANSS